uniref:Putative phosphotransferase n=1 Tax=Rhinella marina erythrocytic-like virus TaxID=2859906 RepID=A0A8F6YJT2_9VIRU|nr:putative phosphotransferase [Rhinella marina erythrocytic-like virus]
MEKSKNTYYNYNKIMTIKPAFTIKEPFVENEGNYGDLFWCSYENDPKKYLCKKLKTIDTSLEIELEAAHRLKFLPTVYNVKRIEYIDGVKWLVSEYIDGATLLDNYKGPHHKLLLLHLLCTLEEMENNLICHNDLHGGNILVIETKLEYVIYHIFGIMLHVKTFGILPVIIDFGMARIEDYIYKPSIAGLNEGELGTLAYNPMYDLSKLLYNFDGVFQQEDLYLKIIAYKYTCDYIFDKIKDWVPTEINKLWEPITETLSTMYPKLSEMIDYNISGPLMSFPNIDVTRVPITKYMRYLESIVPQYTKSQFKRLVYRVLQTGPHDVLYNPFCYIGVLFKAGINKFLKNIPDFFSNVPSIYTIVKYMVKTYPDYIIPDDDPDDDLYNYDSKFEATINAELLYCTSKYGASTVYNPSTNSDTSHIATASDSSYTTADSDDT